MLTLCCDYVEHYVAVPPVGSLIRLSWLARCQAKLNSLALSVCLQASVWQTISLGNAVESASKMMVVSR